MQVITAAEQEVGQMSEKKDIIPKSLLIKGEHKIENNLNKIIQKDEQEL